MLDIQGSSKNAGTQLQIVPWNNSNAQKFKLHPVNNGLYMIECQCSGLYIDVPGSSKKVEKIQQFPKNNTDAQKFYFHPV